MSGLLDVPAIYLSGYIIKNKDKDNYYKSLRGVTEKQQWESYILYMLDMVEVTARHGLNRLERIVNLMDETTRSIKEQLPKIYSKDLIEILFHLPYTKRQHLIQAGLGTPKPKTVGNYLIVLKKEDIYRRQGWARKNYISIKNCRTYWKNKMKIRNGNGSIHLTARPCQITTSPILIETASFALKKIHSLFLFQFKQLFKYIL